jgi:hypothetical protein
MGALVFRMRQEYSQDVPNPSPMAMQRMKHTLKRLDTAHKWLLASSALVALSTIMPWYEDVDAFGAGDRYLGVTGPLFLIGLMVMASALFTTAWIVLPKLGKRMPSLPVHQGALFTFLGIQNLVFLLIANSVFFHPKFGVNIMMKNTRFGMILAFAGVLLMVWSGYRLYRRERRHVPRVQSYENESTSQEPLIKLPDRSREPADLADHSPLKGVRGAMRSHGHSPQATPSESKAQTLRMDL